MKKGLKGALAVCCAFVCAAGFCGCKNATPSEEIAVYMPDGAPALALAKLMHEDTEADGVTYRVVKAELIAAQVTNKDEDKNADLCVMPVTAAAKLLGSGERYVMLGAVTHGNLYIVSDRDTETALTELSALVGKKVGVLQINSVPGLTFKATLNKQGVPWREVTNEGTVYEDKVNLVAISGADAVGTLDADYFVIAEPAASAQAQKGYSIVGDLQTLYGDEKGYTQAVLVAKKAFADENEAWVKSFTENVKNAAAWLVVATGAEIVSAVTAHLDDPNAATTLKAPLLTSEVLARCGVWYTPAEECKEETGGLLRAFIEINESVTAIPNESFYRTL